MTLTFDIQVDGVADAIALGVVCSTCVNPCVSSGNFLKNKTLIRNDDFFGYIM